MKQTKPCKRCEIGRAKLDERFCPRCRDIVLKEMQAKYLQDTYQPKQQYEKRGRSQRYGNAVGGSAELGSDGDA